MVTQDNLADAWEQGFYDWINSEGYNYQDMTYSVRTEFIDDRLNSAYARGVAAAAEWVYNPYYRFNPYVSG